MTYTTALLLAPLLGLTLGCGVDPGYTCAQEVDAGSDYLECTADDGTEYAVAGFGSAGSAAPQQDNYQHNY